MPKVRTLALPLWTGEELDVSERLGTRQIAGWDLLGARVIKGERGRPVIDGIPYLYPLGARPMSSSRS